MNRRDFLKSIGKVIGGLVVALGVIKAVPKSNAFLDAVTHKDAGPLKPRTWKATEINGIMGGDAKFNRAYVIDSETNEIYPLNEQQRS